MKSIKLMGLALLCLLFAACGPTKSDDDKVAEKIDAGAALTEQDYTVVVDYLVKYAKEAQVYQDEINSLPSGDPKAEEATKKLADVTAGYTLLDTFNKALQASTVEGVGPANVKKVNENAALDYFTAPSWAIIDQDPKVAGFIEDMPDTDTTAVISQGDGVVVDKK